MSDDKIGWKTYYCYVKGDKEEISMWDERLANILSEVEGSNTSRKHFTLFRMGIEAYEKEIAERNNANAQSEKVKRSKLAASIDQRSREMDTDAFIYSKLVRFYEKYPIEEFISWSESHDYNWKAFMERYEKDGGSNANTESYSDKSIAFLRATLADGEPHETSKIKKAAIESGLIDATEPSEIEKQWAAIRQAAHHEQMSGRSHGFWVLPRRY